MQNLIRCPLQPEACCLIAAALLATVVFATGGVDIAAAREFYRSDATDHWPLAREQPWLLLYHAASAITASLVIAGLAAFALSFSRLRRTWRGPATLVLLSVVIGPGLLGNAVLKDHWQHPRPRDLVEFGGSMHYVPSPLIGREAGASFPCGHCTVGFLYGIGWWIWKRRRPLWAVASLAAGLLTGFLLGAGRMAAGAHFLSDIVWSAVLAYGVTHLLAAHVLRLAADRPVGAPAEGRQQARWRGAAGFAAVLAAGMVLLALFVLPHGTELDASIALSDSSPRVFAILADRASITLVLEDTPPAKVLVEGELHGFGAPSAHLGAGVESVQIPQPELRYRIEARGWLTDVDGFATVRVPAAAFDRIRVHTGRGNIRVVDTTRAGVVAAGRVELELSTAHGTIQQMQHPAPSLPPAEPQSHAATDRASRSA